MRVCVCVCVYIYIILNISSEDGFCKAYNLTYKKAEIDLL